MTQLPQDTVALSTTIATQLNEQHAPALEEIRRAVELLGSDQAAALLQETLQIEEQGGMLISNGKRRRTPGGVFLYLVRTRVPPEQRRQIFPKRKGVGGQGGKSSAQREKPPAWQPDDLPEVLKLLTDQYGKATTVKITVIGRPTQVVERGDVVIFGLVNEKQPALPKGLPAPPAQTKYLVLVAKKQWGKVSAAIKNEGDALIIEGYPAYEPRHAGITVFTTTITTKQQQAAKRQAQEAAKQE